MTKSSGLQTGLDLSTMGACGTKIVVLISEVSLFQGEKDMYLYNMKLELCQVSWLARCLYSTELYNGVFY